MKYYPVFLRLEGRPCVVVGGGEVAERKVDGLLGASARVTIVAPDLTAALADRARAGEVVWHRRAYRRGDLGGAFLAYAATDDESVNAAVAAEAVDDGIVLNVVDRPSLCSFISPSVVERGDLLIAASTSGASPLLARRIRERLSAEFGPEYAALLLILRALRQRFSDEGRAAPERHRIFGVLIDSPLLDTLRAGDSSAADRILAQLVGDRYTLRSLGLAPDPELMQSPFPNS